MFIPLHDKNQLENIRWQYVSLALIAINVGVWLVFVAPSLSEGGEPSELYYAYGYVPAVIGGSANLPPELVEIPPVASFITYAFLHGGFMHVAGNMLFLWVFGDNVEDAMGHLRFLLFFLACAVAGAIAHGISDPVSQSPLVGASGACAGVVGAYLMLHPNVKIWVLALGSIPVRLPASWLLGAWIAYQVFSFLAFPESEVSWAAHIGGALAGMVLIVFFRKSNVQLFDRDLATAPPKPTKTRVWGRENAE